jgi:hypothetical protein
MGGNEELGQSRSALAWREQKRVLRLAGYNLRHEPLWKSNFFIFFCRNTLNSLDSEKLMKENESK